MTFRSGPNPLVRPEESLLLIDRQPYLLANTPLVAAQSAGA